MAKVVTIGDPKTVYEYRYRTYTKNADGKYEEGDWEVKVSSTKPESGMQYSAGRKTGEVHESIKEKQQYKQYTWSEDSKSFESSGTTLSAGNWYADMGAASAGQVDASSTEWGAQNISKDDMVNPDGSPKDVKAIYEVLDKKLPGITGQDLVNYINEVLPKYQGVAQEEKGFVAEQYGGDTGIKDDPSTPQDESKTSFAESISGREAGAVKEADMYGLQKEANKVGAQVYGGMGAGLRGAIIGQASIKKGFEATQDKYGLAKDKADLASRKGMFRLEEAAGTDFERDVGGTLDAGWTSPTDEQREEADFEQTTEWSSFMKKGGKVPDKESFSQFLTQLPEAGGS